jgi:hypothetical protein
MTMAPVSPRTTCVECGDLISDSHAWVVDWWHPPMLQSQFRHVVCDSNKRMVGLSIRRRPSKTGQPPG